MRTPRSQRGVSLLAWIAILVVVGLFALFGARTVPAYFDYFTLVSVAESIQQESPEDIPPRELRSMINKRMRINNVDDVAESGYDAIAVERGRSEVTLVIDYEVREPFLGNIDLVMSFARRVGP